MHQTLAAVLLAAGTLAAQTPTALLMDTTLDQLWTVDLNTGLATFLVQVTGVATAADLAWREDTRELWTVDLSGGAIGVIDQATGLFTARGATGLSGWQGIAWDPHTRKFYLANQDGNNHVFDPVSGLTTLLGASGFNLVTALAVDAAGTLIGIQFSAPGNLISISKTTGAGTIIAPTSTFNMQGMAHHPDGRLFAVNTSTDSLYLIDQFTGTTTLVGAHGVPATFFAKGFEITGTEAMNGGQGCRDGSGALRNMTVSGTVAINNFFLTGIEPGPTVLPAFFLIGLSASSLGAFPLPADLTPRGAPGCWLYSSSDAIVFTVTGGQVAFVVPNSPSYIGFVVVNQGLILDPNAGANALGIAMTNVQRIAVGP